VKDEQRTMNITNRVHRSTNATATITRYNPKKTAIQINQLQPSTRIIWLMSCIFVCFAVAGILIIRYPTFIRYNTHSEGDIVVKLDDTITLPLRPQQEKIFGIDHYYMFPPMNTTTTTISTILKPKGILIYLHSCEQSGLDFFTLPEHRVVAHDAIYKKGLVVFAPTSYNRQSGCFTNEDLNDSSNNNKNGYHLQGVVKEFIKNHKQLLRKLPRVGMGDSSGGSFLFFVHEAIKLQSMAIYNSPQGYMNININMNDTAIVSMIPTVFLSMSSDISISTRMNINRIKLQEMNVKTKLFEVTPRTFTDRLCTSRFPELPYEFCQNIFDIIERDCNWANSLIDMDGYIIDGSVIKKSVQWQHCFKKIEESSEYNKWMIMTKTKTQESQSFSWLRVILEKEIQACYGYHSMTAQFRDEILTFLMLNAKIDGMDTDIDTVSEGSGTSNTNSVANDEQEVAKPTNR